MEHARQPSTVWKYYQQKPSLANGIVFYDYDVDGEQNIFSFVERNNYDMPCFRSILPSKSEAEHLNHEDTDVNMVLSSKYLQLNIDKVQVICPNPTLC